jgi:hypothetical protein
MSSMQNSKPSTRLMMIRSGKRRNREAEIEFGIGRVRQYLRFARLASSRAQQSACLRQAKEAAAGCWRSARLLLTETGVEA